ncbi:hypothetical protein [Parasitella parasitica]|uniref:Uncharacterized protein n=1 Tax=Parasitella parasitica TaxID=35722 RepID=A0A0B7MZA3_9FUNG|nr:hypothetical protein [Parasitella parasitica]
MTSNSNTTYNQPLLNYEEKYGHQTCEHETSLLTICMQFESRSHVVKQLDLRIQADFPATLTYRLGISKQLAKSMRPAFQHGIGPHRLAKVLRVLHI